MPQKTRQKPPVGEKECSFCRKTKKLTNFYLASNAATSSDGKTVNICKQCIKNESLNNDGSLNIEKFKEMLMFMDKPYIPSALDSAINETKTAIDYGKGRKDIIGNYMKNIASLPQYSKLSFMQSMQLLDGGILNSSKAVSCSDMRQNDEKVYIKQVDDFIVTDDLLDLFGEGFKKTEYRLMYEKFEKMKVNYSMQTNLHEEALATYVRFKVKEEQATAAGNVGEAEKWSKSAQEAANSAKLTPKQLTKADLQGGINSFSEVAKALEQSVDIIRILPRYKYQPNDAPDFIIWCYINYARRLKGVPEVEYSDIYKFYDDKKEEYLSQYGDPYGIFLDDTTVSNRESVSKFIKLPKDYDDEFEGDEDE